MCLSVFHSTLMFALEFKRYIVDEFAVTQHYSEFENVDKEQSWGLEPLVLKQDLAGLLKDSPLSLHVKVRIQQGQYQVLCLLLCHRGVSVCV
jgi:hypothetical protein